MMRAEPEFKLNDGFVVILRRRPGAAFESVGGITPQVTPEVTPQVTPEVIAQATAQGTADEGVGEGVKKVLAFIRNNPLCRVPTMAQGAGITKKTIERYIKKLKEPGEIEFTGAPKTGEYRLIAGEE